MADQLKLRGGTEAQSENFTGASREVTVDTTLNTLRVHDGVTPGGHKLLKAGDCLVVEENDPCNPAAETCKVTINGDLEVNGESNLGDTIIDGNLIVNGDFVQDGITLAVKTDEVILTNPGPINTRDAKAVCKILPSSGNLRTQEDANQYLDECLKALENAICDFDLAAIDEIQDIKDDLTKIWAAIAALENRLDLVESDINALKARVDLIEQAIALLETEIEALSVTVHENQAAIEALKVLVLDLEQEVGNINNNLSDLELKVDNLKLDDLKDCAVPAPSDGQQLVFRSGQWVAEDNAFAEQAVHFMGFINVEDDSAPTGADVKVGDTYIQHKVDESDATANGTWAGIDGELVTEGQYVMYGSDSKWHKGKSVENVDQIQSDWNETDTSSAAYIQNKPDLQAEINSRVNDGRLTIKDSDGATVGTFTANQAGNTDVILPKGFSGDYNDLNNKPTIGNGRLTIKNSDGSTAGSFTANQDGDTTVSIAAPPVQSQFTKQRDSWRLETDGQAVSLYEKVIDVTLLDKDNSIYFATSDLNWGSDVGYDLVTGPDAQNRLFTRRMQTNRYVYGSLWYHRLARRIYWLEYTDPDKGDLFDLKLMYVTYEGGVVDTTPVEEMSGNIGQFNQYFFDSDFPDETIFDVWVFDQSSKDLQRKVWRNGAWEDKDVWNIPAMTKCLTAWGYAEHLDAFGISTDNSTGKPVDHWFHKVHTHKNEWEEQIAPVGDYPIGFAGSYNCMIVSFPNHCIILDNLVWYYISKNPHQNSREDMPKIHHLANGVDIFYTERNNSLVLKKVRSGNGMSETIELVSPNMGSAHNNDGYWQSFSVKGAKHHEAFAKIQVNNQLWIYDDKQPDYKCELKRDPSIVDGMIVLDPVLTHGEIFYFADEGLAKSPNCHLM